MKRKNDPKKTRAQRMGIQHETEEKNVSCQVQLYYAKVTTQSASRAYFPSMYQQEEHDHAGGWIVDNDSFGT
ncbi:hypothetical protein CR513_30858, partial [Mucuna pruriens]